MRTTKIFPIILTSLLLALLLYPAKSSAYISQFNSSTSIVVGQADFTHGSANAGGSVSAYGYDGETNQCVAGNKLLVADTNNNRVLIYNSIPTSNNASADIVIGQANFTNHAANDSDGDGVTDTPSAKSLRAPTYCYFDGSKLFISDKLNNRILIFNAVPTSNYTSADTVIGQPDFSTVSSGTSASKFYAPMGIFRYGNQLFVAEQSNNRVVIFNSVPTINGTSADLAIGQTNLNSGLKNQDNTNNAKANGLYAPLDVRVIDGKVIISEWSNHRALIFNSIPTGFNASADLVIGQTNFTSSTANQGQTNPSANTLNGPYLLSSSNNKLVIADLLNQRILIYLTTPTVSNVSADLVIGQQNFTSKSSNQGLPNPTAYTLASPKAGIIANNKLIAADSSNNRVLIYNLGPENTSVSIATQTSSDSPNVTLALSATGAKEMMISNYSDFRDGVWETFATSKDWTLLSGSGDRTVYAKFRDWGNFESDPVSTNGMVALPATGRKSSPLLYLIIPFLVLFSSASQIKKLSQNRRLK